MNLKRLLPAAPVLRAGAAMVLIAALAACSSTSKPKPAELPPNPSTLAVRQAWSAKLPAVDMPLQVAVSGDVVTVAAADGTVAAIDARSGAQLWRASAGAELSAGVGSDGQTAAVVYDMMRDEFGLDLPFDEWIARKYDHYLANVGGLQARPGAVEVFRELKARGVAQAVVSNSDRLIVDANLRMVGLALAGLRTVSRNDVREGKPHPEPFLRAAWLAGVEPADAVAIDDSVTGASSGLAAGMKTIFWPERPMLGPAGAITIDTPEALRAELGL